MPMLTPTLEQWLWMIGGGVAIAVPVSVLLYYVIRRTD